MRRSERKANTSESEVSGLINDSWSCLVVWFYKNKLLAIPTEKKFSRSHNQVQGNKSKIFVEIKIFLQHIFSFHFSKNGFKVEINLRNRK